MHVFTEREYAKERGSGCMKLMPQIRHEFVDQIPTDIKVGILYVSIQYSTAVHKCCCGCGNEVVTPLSPTDWKLIFDGETVSLTPSIGNWSLECQSHYWIEHGTIRWAARWSRREIEDGRARDKEAKRRYFETRRKASDSDVAETSAIEPHTSTVDSPGLQSRAKKT